MKKELHPNTILFIKSNLISFRVSLRLIELHLRPWVLVREDIEKAAHEEQLAQQFMVKAVTGLIYWMHT